MSFNLKDKVVYPGHGVAVIDEITEKNVSGASIKFFKLKFLFIYFAFINYDNYTFYV